MVIFAQECHRINCRLIMFFKVKTDLGCRVFVDDEYRGIAKGGAINRFEIDKGEYWVRFESLSDSNVSIEKKVQVPDWDVLEVVLLRPIMHRFILRPHQNEGRWGYVEYFSGLAIIAPEYDEAGSFSDGYAIVRKGQSFGLVRNDGIEVLSCSFDEITRLWGGCFVVKQNGRFAIFHSDTPENLSFDFDSWDYVWNEAKRDGSLSLGYNRPKESSLILIKQDGKVGIYDCLKNRMLLPCVYDRIGYPGNAAADDRRLAYIQGSCDILTRRCELIGTIPNYKEYSAFFLVGDYVLVRSDKLLGALDMQGNTVIDCRYDTIDTQGFHNGLIIVGKKCRRFDKMVIQYGYVNTKGEEIIPCIYDSAVRFVNDVTFVSRYENPICGGGRKLKKLFIDKKGQELFEVKESIKELFSFYKGVAHFKTSTSPQRDGLIKENGEVILGGVHDSPWPESNDWASEYFFNGFCSVKSSRFIFYDDDGFPEGDPEFSDAVIGIDGKMIVPYFKYEQLFYFDGFQETFDGPKTYVPDKERAVTCISREKGKYGLLGRDGREIIPCEYDSIIICADILTLETSAWVKNDGKYALFDSKTGEQITSFRYDHWLWFYGGRAFAVEDGHVVIIDKAGKVLSSTPYPVHPRLFGLRMCRVSTDSGIAYLSLESLKLYPCDEKYDSAHMEDGLVRLVCHKKEKWDWDSERILDAQTGLEYLPEINERLTVVHDANSFCIIQ